jgi:hypothetical protein
MIVRANELPANKIPNGYILEIENKWFEVVGRITIRSKTTIVMFNPAIGRAYIDRKEIIESIKNKDGWVKVIGYNI